MTEYKISEKTQLDLKEMREIMGFQTYEQFFIWIIDELKASRLPRLQRTPKECEKGSRATCWHCGKQFTKIEQCPICFLYYCPSCGKCGCTLSAETKNAVYLTIKTFTGIDLRKLLPKTPRQIEDETEAKP